MFCVHTLWAVQTLVQAHVALLIHVYPSFQPLSSPSPGHTQYLYNSLYHCSINTGYCLMNRWWTHTGKFQLWCNILALKIATATISEISEIQPPTWYHQPKRD